MNAPSIYFGQQLDDRSLIESIISSYFIIDYGFITEINADKTVNVTHAKRPKTLTNESLPELITNNIEVLTFAGKGFSLKFDYAKGDKVLLLGLKNFIENVDDVTTATETTSYIHYSRDTLKAVPLCIFNEDAKVKIVIEDGTLQVETENNIELNGNDKRFVTFQELDDALQDVWTAVQNHTHMVNTTGTAAAQSGTAAASTDLASKMLDISAAKTETVRTGG